MVEKTFELARNDSEVRFFIFLNCGHSDRSPG